MSYTIQRSQEWKEWRRKKIGASDAPILMNVSPWQTPLQLYNEKISDIEIDVEENNAQREGIRKEPLALAKFEQETGYLMCPAVKVHPTIEFLSASLDGLEISGEVALEIKAPGREDHELALNGVIPEKYVPQLQHQMEVLGHDRIYYMSYVSDDDYKILEVKKDYEYTKLLLDKEHEFWQRIQHRNPPQPTDRDCIKMQSEEWEICVSEWKELESIRDKAEHRQTELKEKLIKLADNRSAEGAGIELTRSYRKGRIEYTMMPELIGVDCEPYRKKGSYVWTLSIK